MSTKAPALRFKQEDGSSFPDWQKSRLGKIVDFTGGGTPSKSVDKYWKGKVPWISSSNLNEHSIREVSISNFITDEAIKHSATKMVPKNSILLVSRVGVGKLAVSTVPLCTSQDFTNLTPREDDVYFLAYLLKSNTNRLQSFSQGTSIKGFSRKDVATLNVFLPCLEEQKKIAAFLGAIDEKVSKLQEKLETLETYKRGVMQKLFSQELRFRQDDGSSFPDWRIQPLRDLAYRKTKKNIEDQSCRVLTNSATQGIVEQRSYFDRDIANPNNLEGYYLITQEDFVYNPRISVNAPVGPISKNKIGDGVISPLYIVFRFHTIDNGFYEQFFNTSYWHQYMYSVANYGARHDRMNIKVSDLMDMPLPVIAKDEQKKIANFLTALDDKIAATSQKIAAVETYKRGLLQQMFI